MDRCEKFRDPDQEPERPESIAHHAANSLGAAGSPRSRRMPRALRWLSWRARCRRSAQEALVDESTTTAGTETRRVGEADTPISLRTRTGRKEEPLTLDEPAVRSGFKSVSGS